MKKTGKIQLEPVLWHILVILTSCVAVYFLSIQLWKEGATALLTLSMFVFYAMFSKYRSEKYPLPARVLSVAACLVPIFFGAMEKRWDTVGNAVVAILIFLLPLFLQKKLRMRIPPTFQIIIFIYILVAMFLGEVFHFYYRYRWWDVIAHISSAPFLGYAGFVMVCTLNRDKSLQCKLSPFFIAFFAFSFSVLVGVTWELFEYLSDAVTGSNMQKARDLQYLYGYIDTRLGVLDTMEDLAVNFLGAFVVSFIGYRYLKKGDLHNSMFWRGMDQFLHDNPELFD